MTMYHAELANGRWNEFSFDVQMANVGSEVERTIKWKTKGNIEESKAALFRALELIDLTRLDPKNRHGLRELCRMRELLCDTYFGENVWKQTDEQWQKYFMYFAWCAAYERSQARVKTN